MNVRTLAEIVESGEHTDWTYRELRFRVTVETKRMQDGEVPFEYLIVPFMEAISAGMPRIGQTMMVRDEAGRATPYRVVGHSLEADGGRKWDKDGNEVT